MTCLRGNTKLLLASLDNSGLGSAGVRESGLNDNYTKMGQAIRSVDIFLAISHHLIKLFTFRKT